MGNYTYANFKDYLKLRFGNADSFDSYYGVWINSAYTQLCSRDKVGNKKLEIPELFCWSGAGSPTTTAGVAYVTLSTSNKPLHYFNVFDATNNVDLAWMSYSEYYSKTDRTTTAARAKPTFYSTYNRLATTINLYPTPDGAYSIHLFYYGIPAPLTSDSGLTIIGREWDDIILEIAHSIGRSWVGEPEKAEMSRKLSDEMILNLMGTYERSENSRREKIRPDPAWHSRGNGY